METETKTKDTTSSTENKTKDTTSSTENKTKDTSKAITLTKEKKPIPQDTKMPTGTFPTDTYYHHKFSCDKSVKLDHSYHNGMLNTIMAAYNKHLPLHLYPDDIQLLLDNIVSKYINESAETFRAKFVDHEGQKKLHVNMDNLRSLVTSDISVWDLTLEKWSEMVGKNIKDKDFLNASTCNFSTSTYIDKLCSAAFVMDSTKAFFQFSCSTECGIPTVYLHGVAEDWEKLVSKVELFNKLLDKNFSKYMTDCITPVLKMFVETKKEKMTSKITDFWGRIISHKTLYGSGSGTFWSGWLINFFPSIHADGEYDWSTKKVKSNGSVRIYLNDKLDRVPSGLTEVPIIFDNNGTEIKLTLHAGFHGTEQSPDGSVKVIKGYYLKKTD